MRLVKSIFIASTLLSTTALSAQAEINVVASVKPVHSLVAAVMEGVGQPDLIVDGAASPHTYALKPSKAQLLENADVVFWFGHELEAFLEKPLEAIATKAKAVELLDAHDLNKLEFREGGAFDEHDHEGEEGHDDDHDDHDHDEKAEKHDDHDHDKEEHDDHDHDKEEDHAKHDDHHDHDKKADKHDDHDHDKEEHAEHEEHDDHDGHDHGEFDPHVWLDPMNAKALVHEIEETLVEADPDNAAKYEANAEAVMKKLDDLINQVSIELEPVKDRGFVVFHDAYQYFEQRFDLNAVGSITVSPEVMPGAERISELQTKIKELNAACVFSEPQFESKLVSTVTEGTSAKSGVLDPLGASIADGPELYFTLIKDMATSFKICLSEG